MRIKSIAIKFILVFVTATLFSSNVAYSRTIKVIIDKQKNGYILGSIKHDWDDFSDPDPYIEVDGDSYKSHKCKNRFTCVFDLAVGPGPLTITVKEADVAGSEDAGSTVCDTGQSCRTKNAWVYVLD